MVERKKHLRAAVGLACREGRLVASAFHATRWGLAYLSRKPALPLMRAADHEELRWITGHEGESRARERWASLFSNSWTLVCGYQNCAGEIDQILVGPTGVHAIEVKNINGRISCDGDRWWRDRFDSYGNLVEARIPIRDKRGRGPSAQLNASADLLEDLLARHAGIPRVWRVVAFAHPRARMGKLRRRTVNWIGPIDALTAVHFAGNRSTSTSQERAGQVVSLIESSHRLKKGKRDDAERHCPSGFGNAFT